MVVDRFMAIENGMYFLEGIPPRERLPLWRILKGKDFFKDFEGNGIEFENQKENPGIPTIKRDDIVTEICPLMPCSHQMFWKDISINVASLELINNDEEWRILSLKVLFSKFCSSFFICDVVVYFV